MTSETVSSVQDSQTQLFSLRTLHLFSLCSFAVTQPLLTALEGQTVYLHDQQIGWLEIGVMLTTLLFFLPLACVLVDRIVGHLFGRYGRNVVLFVLIGLVLLSLIRKCIGITWILLSGNAFILSVGSVIPGACLLVFLYNRRLWLRSWLTCASIGLVVFPGMFLWQFRANSG